MIKMITYTNKIIVKNAIEMNDIISIVKTLRSKK